MICVSLVEEEHEEACTWNPPDSAGVFFLYNLSVWTYNLVMNSSHQKYNSMLSASKSPNVGVLLETPNEPAIPLTP